MCYLPDALVLSHVSNHQKALGLMTPATLTESQSHPEAKQPCGRPSMLSVGLQHQTLAIVLFRMT